MNCALITHRVHKAPIAKGHRQWMEYGDLVRAMRLRRRSGVLRTEPIYVVSALRAPAAIARRR